MKHVIIAYSILLIISCKAQETPELLKAPLTQTTNIVFADSILAAKIVSTDDEFTKVLSAYDRSAGMQSATPASKEVFIHHLAKNVMSWPENEISRLTESAKKVGPRLQELNLNLPKEIVLIRTTSEEVGGADPAYTRQNAIMFTAPLLIKVSDSLLTKILVHEIAHVYSRHNKDRRNRLYNIFGFRQSNDIKLPKNWDDRRLSNPDAPALNTIIDVKHDGQVITLTPLTYAQIPVYDTTKSGGIFQSFDFKMMQVEEKEGLWQPVFFDGNPVLFNPSPKELPDFWRQIGKNTNYIIHPEEIMASNFEFLVTKKVDIPNPEILKKMEGIISQK